MSNCLKLPNQEAHRGRQESDSNNSCFSLNILAKT